MRTRTLLTTLALILVVIINGCKKDEYLAKVGVCPLVVSTIPADKAVGIPLNQVVSATFNEKMDPATITQESFTLTGTTTIAGTKAATVVAGTVSYSGVTASFTPASALTPNTTYTGRIKTLAKDLMGNALNVEYTWTFTTGVPPTVTATDPANTAISVVLGKVVTATFSVPMDPATLSATTFSVKLGTTVIAGTISYAGSTVSFTPSASFAPNTTYTGTITTGAMISSGIPLAADYVWTFSTGVSPTVLSSDPVNNATGIVLGKIVAATFSVPMDPSTFSTTTFNVKQGSTTIAGAVTYSGTTALFTPTITLTPNTVYTATITTGVKNVAGLPIVNDYVWTFTTGISPTVTLTDPANNATGIVYNKVVAATFSVPMDLLTLNATTFTLKQGTTSIAGAVTYSGSMASFNPTADLLPATVYTATITKGAKNALGIPLLNDYVWSFTTASLPVPTITLTDPLNNAIGVSTGKTVTANFSIPMDQATLTATTFTIKQGATLVAGAVSYTGSVASFNPTIAFLPGTIYTATITTGAKSAAGASLANNYVWNFTTALLPVPTITLTDPLNNATGVVLTKTVTANFSIPMDQSTLTATTFTIKQGAALVAGAVSYTGSVASFDPTIAFLPGTIYTATITTGAKSAAGASLANNYVWTFTTALLPVPTITLTDPLNNAISVSPGKTVTAIFSIAMNQLTLTGTTFTLKQGVTPVAGSVSYAGTTASFNPSADLLANTVYTATITTGAKTLAGASLESNYVWSFTTSSINIPAVVSTDPLNLATGVALNKIVGATFDVSMDPLTITSSSFTLKAGATSVSGLVNYSGKTATFSPNSNLLPSTLYIATITSAVKNLAGVSIASNYMWSFTTSATLVVPPIVNLNSAARFGILSGVGISNNAGFSVINNQDVGIYPGFRSSVTGFPPATIVGGAIYAADDIAPPGTPAMLNQAKLDLVAAYLFAEGATTPAPATVSGDQGGKTLAPGIYKSTSTLLIQSGDLTLDGQGDPNATWIFQIASAFTTVGGAGGSIILTGGAKAKNIFWQTGSSAVIGDYTTFYGNVLALQSITLNSHAVATGRMLAQNGAVVMTATNTINKP